MPFFLTCIGSKKLCDLNSLNQVSLEAKTPKQGGEGKGGERTGDDRRRQERRGEEIRLDKISHFWTVDGIICPPDQFPWPKSIYPRGALQHFTSGENVRSPRNHHDELGFSLTRSFLYIEAILGLRTVHFSAFTRLLI